MTTMDRENVCEKRKTIYTLLAYLLINEPSQEWLDNLTTNKDLMREIADDESLFIGYLDGANLESIKQEYYDRFFVTSSSNFIPPFEYAIRNRTTKDEKTHFGKLLSKQSFHVADCYTSVGFNPERIEMFQPLREMQQYPDHLAFELAFMVFLLNGEAKVVFDEEKANEWQARQYQFLSEHLGVWVDDFYKLAHEKAPGLYTEIFQVINQWIQEDMSYLASIYSN